MKCTYEIEAASAVQAHGTFEAWDANSAISKIRKLSKSVLRDTIYSMDSIEVYEGPNPDYALRKGEAYVVMHVS